MALPFFHPVSFKYDRAYSLFVSFLPFVDMNGRTAFFVVLAICRCEWAYSLAFCCRFVSCRYELAYSLCFAIFSLVQMNGRIAFFVVFSLVSIGIVLPIVSRKIELARSSRLIVFNSSADTLVAKYKVRWQQSSCSRWIIQGVFCQRCNDRPPSRRLGN